MFFWENFAKMIDSLWSLGFHVLIILTIYLVPIIIAYSRKIEKRLPLSIVNIFLGWTFIAWIACIAWAFLGKTNKNTQQINCAYIEEQKNNKETSI